MPKRKVAEIGKGYTRSLDAFVTFNGNQFDLRTLQKNERGWQFRGIHVDLREMFQCLKYKGKIEYVNGLKGLEQIICGPIIEFRKTCFWTGAFGKNSDEQVA